MDHKKLKKLQREIQTAASLTQHQASKVTGAVLTVIGGKNVENMLLHNDTFVEDTNSNRKPEDCAKDCKIPLCDNCPDFIPILDTKDATEHLVKLRDKSGVIIDTDLPPFELDEELTLYRVEIETGSVVFTPKEFELIKHTLKGAIKSTINEKVNVLRKYGDNPEQFEEAIEDIRIISKLISRLDKI